MRALLRIEFQKKCPPVYSQFRRPVTSAISLGITAADISTPPPRSCLHHFKLPLSLHFVFTWLRAPTKRKERERERKKDVRRPTCIDSNFFHTLAEAQAPPRNIHPKSRIPQSFKAMYEVRVNYELIDFFLETFVLVSLFAAPKTQEEKNGFRPSSLSLSPFPLSD